MDYNDWEHNRKAIRDTDIPVVDYNITNWEGVGMVAVFSARGVEHASFKIALGHKDPNGRICIGFTFPDVPQEEGVPYKQSQNSLRVYKESVMRCDADGWLWATVPPMVMPLSSSAHEGIRKGEHGDVLIANKAVYKYALELKE